MKKIVLTLAGVWWGLATATGYAVNNEDLADMPMAELLEVEISRGEAFDIFNALVRRQSVSVATGKRQDAARAPSVTSVITARDIEVMGARTLGEILQTVPGIQVTSTWTNGTVYTMRGLSTRDNPEVLLLVNGLRAHFSYSSSKGIDSWSGFPVSAIARVEIIRGPGSAVYGADAFAGVINLITKTVRDLEGTEIGARMGSFETRDAWLIHGTRWEGFEITTILDVSHSDGHQRTVESDAQTLFDQQHGTNASLAPGPFNNHRTAYDARLDIAKKNWRFRTNLHRGEEIGGGAGIAEALDPTHPMREELFNAELLWSDRDFSKNWGLASRLAFRRQGFEYKWVIFPPGAINSNVLYPNGFLGNPSAYETETQLALSAVFHGWQGHLLRLGTGYGYYDMYKTREWKNFGPNPHTGGVISPLEMVGVSDTAAVFIPETARDSKYVFLQDTWALNAHWELTAGVRHDEFSDFGGTTNPRLGLVWAPRHDITAKLLYGRAFRAPSLQEQYNRNNPVFIGNPDLQPEKMETWEIAMDYRLSNTLNLAVNLFRYEVEDKITIQSSGTTNLGYVNGAKWEGQGGELEFRWKTSPRSSLLFNYSYQDSEDQDGHRLPNGPRQKVYLRGDYLLGQKWFFDTQINWNDGWTREVHDPRPALDGYTTVDLILRHKNIRGGQSNIAVGVRNLFDADVRYPSQGPGASGALNLPDDIPGPGRYYFMDYRYTFQ